MIATENVVASVLTSDHELASIDTAWNALLDDSSYSSFNMRPLWLRAWWGAFAPAGARLQAIACRDADGALVGFTPLYLDAARELRFVGLGGDGPANFTAGVIARRGFEAPVMASVVETIERTDEWDRLWLARMRPEVETTRLLVETYGARANVISNPERNLWLPARGDYETYRQSLGRAGRKRVQRYARRAVERGCVFRRVASREELARAYEVYLAWHAARFAGRGIYESPHRAAFLRDVVLDGFANGTVRAWTMELEGAIVAVDMAFVDRGVLIAHQGHADPALADMRLGHVMTAHFLRDCYEDPAIDEVVLGRDADHKRYWTERTWGTIDLIHARTR